MSDMTVAKTILAQLGGSAFITMTGAYGFTGDAQSLTMRLRMMRGRATHFRVTLEPSDTYKVEMLRCNVRTGVTVVETAEDIYNDMLPEVFRRMTGLETRMPRVFVKQTTASGEFDRFEELGGTQ